MRTINPDPLLSKRAHNLLQTALIFLALGSLVAAAGWFVFGLAGLIITFILWSASILLLPKFSPYALFSLYRAKPLSPAQAPRLYIILRTLGERAALSHTPELYYIPTNAVTAFSTGTQERSAIALSDGMIALLTLEELAGVLAHEISHIRHNDIHVMQVADIAGILAAFFSSLGLFLTIPLIPVLMLYNIPIPWIGIMLFLAIPMLNALLQLSLSRTREYGADLDAATLCRNPMFLASALIKIERLESGALSSYLNPFRRTEEPSLLRTHPLTSERIRRLLELARTMPQEPMEVIENISADAIKGTGMALNHARRFRWLW